MISDKKKAYRAKWMREWRIKHPEKHKFLKRKSETKLRNETLVAYGGKNPKCSCCGESEEAFLCIDHINGNGREERNLYSFRRGGANFYRHLRKLGFPKGYQILCYNCNITKHTRGICPHKNTK